MSKRSTTEPIFALRQLTEKYRESQNDLYTVFIGYMPIEDI